MFGFPEIVTLFIKSIVSRRGRAYKKKSNYKEVSSTWSTLINILNFIQVLSLWVMDAYQNNR